MVNMYWVEHQLKQVCGIKEPMDVGLIKQYLIHLLQRLVRPLASFVDPHPRLTVHCIL